jgi:hypothetical protein
MKKALAVVAVLAITGGAAYALGHDPPRAACLKMADLCGVENGTPDDLSECVAEIKQWRKIAGDDVTDKGLACVNEAKTCGEATGCVAGAGFKGAQGVLNEFLKGFGKAAQ